MAIAYENSSGDINEQIDRLHDLLWALVTSNPERLQQSKWNCPFQAFLAGRSVMVGEGGTSTMPTAQVDCLRLQTVMRVIVLTQSHMPGVERRFEL